MAVHIFSLPFNIKHMLLKNKLKRYLVFLLLIASLDVSSQSPYDKIDPDHFNIEYLEHLVKIKIDSVRHSHSLYTLVNDSILYVAAKQHANYLVKKNILSHFQKNKSHANPQSRAEYYGAQNYFVGENVASVFILTPTKSKRMKKPHINETYEDAALELAIGWVKSKPHFKNIKYKKYQITGLALAYDSDKKNIKAVQMFAEVKSKFIFTENTNYFIYEEPFSIEYNLEKMDQVSRIPHKGRHRWHIRLPKKKFKRCKECSTIYKAKDDLIFYVDSIKNIHAFASNPGIVKKVTKRQRDGLAIETVQYTPYECGNKDYFLEPSRRNGQCIANGNIQKPLYKWKMKKEWRKAYVKFRIFKLINGLQPIVTFQFREYPKILPTIFAKFPGIPLDWTLGKLPENDSTYYEINIVILKRKRECGIIHFTDFCGAPFAEIRTLSTLPDFTAKPFVYPEDTLKSKLTIPFEKNKYQFKPDDIIPLVNKLTPANTKIILVEIHAYSSVEGSLEKNVILMNKRSQSIIDVIRATQKDSISQSISAQEDWKQFYEQIKNTPYAGLKKLKREQIKLQLENDSISLKLESLLSKQRRAVVTINSMQIVSLKEKMEAGQKEFQELMDKASNLKVVPPKLLEKLLILQSYLYKQVLEGNMDSSVLFKTIIPQDPAYCHLLTNQLYYKIKFNYPVNLSENEVYASVKEIALFKNSSSVAKYNLMVLLVNKWKEDKLFDSDTLLTPEKMLKIIQSINSLDVNKDSLNRLSLNFYFKAAAWCLLNEPDNKLRKKCLNGIYNHYVTVKTADTVVLKLAKYFIWHREEKKAYRILKPYALKKDPNHELLMLFLKMSYVHSDEDPRNKFFKWMADAAIVLNQEEYCNMFSGPCNMSFQVFDNETIRNKYCEICKGKSNFALDYKFKKRKEKEK